MDVHTHTHTQCTVSWTRDSQLIMRVINIIISHCGRLTVINAPCNSATDLTIIISPAGRVVVRGWVHRRNSIPPSPSYIIIIITIICTSYDDDCYCIEVFSLFNAGAKNKMCAVHRNNNIMVVVNWGVARPTTTDCHTLTRPRRPGQILGELICDVCSLSYGSPPFSPQRYICRAIRRYEFIKELNRHRVRNERKWDAKPIEASQCSSSISSRLKINCTYSLKNRSSRVWWVTTFLWMKKYYIMVNICNVRNVSSQ